MRIACLVALSKFSSLFFYEDLYLIIGVVYKLPNVDTDRCRLHYQFIKRACDYPCVKWANDALYNSILKGELSLLKRNWKFSWFFKC